MPRITQPIQRRKGRPKAIPAPGTKHFIYRRPPWIVKDGPHQIGAFETFEEAEKARDEYYREEVKP